MLVLAGIFFLRGKRRLRAEKRESVTSQQRSNENRQAKKQLVQQRWVRLNPVLDKNEGTLREGEGGGEGGRHP